jgi:hypothetical protein
MQNMPEKTIEIDLEESQKWPVKTKEEWRWCLVCKMHYRGPEVCIHCGSEETKVTREVE